MQSVLTTTLCMIGTNVRIPLEQVLHFFSAEIKPFTHVAIWHLLVESATSTYTLHGAGKSFTSSNAFVIE